jgi:hypothetical protein
MAIEELSTLERRRAMESLILRRRTEESRQGHGQIAALNMSILTTKKLQVQLQ